MPALLIGHYQRKFAAGAHVDPAFKPWFSDGYSGVLITPEAQAQREAIAACLERPSAFNAAAAQFLAGLDRG